MFYLDQRCKPRSRSRSV